MKPPRLSRSAPVSAATITTRNFTQGTIQSTGGAMDAAIQGNGFFVVQDSAGDTMYTRDGSFNLNSSGQMITSSGALVQGWMATNGVVNASGATGPITVPLLSSQPPVPTANMSLDANLNASAAKNDTFSTPIQVYDSLGDAHTLTVSFTNTGANAWTYNVNIPGQDLTGGTAGTLTSIATGSLTFDSSGNLDARRARHGRREERYRARRRRSDAQHQLESVRRERQLAGHAVRADFGRDRHHAGRFGARHGHRRQSAERRRVWSRPIRTDHRKRSRRSRSPPSPIPIR